MVDNQRRKKVTLVWNGEDIARVFGSLFHAGDIDKYIDLPLANYSTLPFDKVLKDGKIIGVSTYTGYTYNERAMLSLGVVDVEHSEPGTQVTLVWGEEGRGSTKPTVERHAASRDPCHGCVCALRRSCACRIPAALSNTIGEIRWRIYFTKTILPKLVAVVPGPRAHLLRQQGTHQHRRHAGGRDGVQSPRLVARTTITKSASTFTSSWKARARWKPKKACGPVGPGDLVFIPAEAKHRLRATETGLFYFEFQAPNRFKTHILDGTPDDLRWNRVDGRVWVQT